MQKVIFVIGATASGKTYFIDTHYADKNVEILNVYDYQQRAYDEAGFGEAIPFGAQFRCLMDANNKLLSDIIEKLKQGKSVVVEQTFFKAKRRIAYIDEIRKAADVMIETYVMSPTDALWESNLKKREIGGTLQHHKEQAAIDIEFPNPAEGIDRIYKVVDGEIQLKMEHFGLLGPRTCGDCRLKDTLFWRVNTDKKIPLPIVVERALTPEELVTWKRIKGEPESLL